MIRPLMFAGWNFNPGPITQIQPFTYGDGVTFVELLYELKRYVTEDVVPMVNEFPETVNKAIEALIESVDAALVTQSELVDAKLAAQDDANDEKIQILTDYVNQQIEEVLNASVSVQDAVMKQVFELGSSQTRAVTDVLYAAKSIEDVVSGIQDVLSGRLSQTEMDDRYANKTNTATSLTALQGRATSLEQLVNSGRLSQTSLDARYVLKEISPVAVFFGSSNATAGTWTEQFCTMMGFTNRNYAIGGGSFTGSGSGTFASQVATANADSTLDKAAVKYVFMVDAGNDMRAQGTEANFRTNANATLNTMRGVFPNARIIIIPALWGITPGITLGNLELGAIRALTQFTQTLKDLSLVYNMEVVEDTHLWHYDSTAWMKPGEVHYTPAGYTRVAQLMRDYMRTGDAPEMSIGNTTVAGKTGVDSSAVLCGRSGNFMRINGTINVTTALGNDGDMFQLPEGVFPLMTAQVPMIAVSSRAPSSTAVIFGAGGNRGLVRTFGPLATGQYYLHTVQPTF